MTTIKTNDVAMVEELSDAELDGVAGGFNVMTFVVGKALAEKEGVSSTRANQLG